MARRYTAPMANEVRATPSDLADLARANLTASTNLDDGHRAQQGTLAVPAGAFGNTAVAGSVQVSHQDALTGLDIAVGRLVAVYEGDVDKLYQTSANYQKADEDAADKIEQHRLNIPL